MSAAKSVMKDKSWMQAGYEFRAQREFLERTGLRQLIEKALNDCCRERPDTLGPWIVDFLHVRRRSVCLAAPTAARVVLCRDRWRAPTSCHPRLAVG